MKYRADIDGIRAIAVLLVVVFHFGLIAFGQGGFIGVDIFFVISGYLISRVIWRDLDAGAFSLRHFYARRVRRLAPALVMVQLLVLAGGMLLLLPNELAQLAKESIAAQTYVSNIYYWKTLDYFGLHADGAFMLHTWSLGVEEQFYLIYPLVLIAVHRWARRWFWPLLAAAVLASFALNIAFTPTRPATAFYLLPMRAWELGVGALLPLAEAWFGRHAAARAVATPAGLALIVIALVAHGPATPFPGWFALLPVAGGACLLLGGSGDSSPVSRLLALRPITFFGRISYPLYLIHWPLHIFAVTLLPDYGAGWRWAMFALSVALAWAITRLEAPFRKSTMLPRDRTLMRAYAGVVVAMVSTAAVLLASHGWRGRFAPRTLAVVDVADNYDREGRSFAFNAGDAIARRARLIGRPGVAPTWLIYGDSHARALSRSIDRWLRLRGEAGEIIYRSSCMPLLDVGVPACREMNRKAVAHAAGRQVLLVSIWREPLDPGYRGRDATVLEGPAAIADAQGAIGRTVAALRGAGATVHVWEPLPTARRDVPQAMARATIYGPYWPVARPLAAHRQEMGFVAAALDRAGVPKADRIDPAPAVCPGGICGFVQDGLPLYSDTNHPASHTAGWFTGLLVHRARFAQVAGLR